MDLLVGYGESIITPPIGVDLTGYGFYLDRKAKDVLDDLKVRVLYLCNGIDKLILISCDLLGFSVDFSDNLRRDIGEREGIDVKDILIACIHTHSGPAVRELRGLGDVDVDYLQKIKGEVITAVEVAKEDFKNAKVSYHTEIVEPIGFNRRLKSFEPIDPMLNILRFSRDDRDIYLVNYACHPVVLGKTDSISADWPGRFIHGIERNGDKALFFQGFCGDIDPVTNMNRWGEGTEEDIILLGHILTERAFKSKRYGKMIDDPILKSYEKRIRLPLHIPSREDLIKEYNLWMDIYRDDINARAFISNWLEKAEANYERFRNSPYIDNIPIHAISIGDVKLIGIPGEVFCEYGLKLRKRFSPLFTLGYSDGLVGYIPVKEAYMDRRDYACYLAPKIFNLFPFSPEIEDLILQEAIDVLERVSESPG